MEFKIYGYSGVEREFELEIITDNTSRMIYVQNIYTTIRMDQEGYGSVTIDSIHTIEYDTDGNVMSSSELSEQEITELQEELSNYVDWERWIEDQRPEDEDYKNCEYD